MTPFPDSPWKPDAAEYFYTKAPDGSPLHGSSTLRRFVASPRLFGEELEAFAALDALQLWEAMKATAVRAVVARQGSSIPPKRMALVETTRPTLSPRHVRTIRRLKPTAAMLFGSAVEYYTFPTSGEPKPELSDSILKAAEWRADDIRRHEVAGAFTRAPGAAYQVAHRWKDPASGLWLRMRLDCAYHSGRGPSDSDLKIWARVTAGNLEFKIEDGGALAQEAIYARGKMDLWGITTPKTLVVAGPKSRDKIFTVELSKRDIREADDSLSFTLDRLAKAYEEGDFSDPEERVTKIRKRRKGKRWEQQT